MLLQRCTHSILCQTYSQVRTGCCFANASPLPLRSVLNMCHRHIAPFLVGDGDDLCVHDFTSFLIVAVVSGNRKSRHFKIIKWRPFLMPESLKQKKHPVICYWVPALESYLIVQIWSDYAKPSSEKSGVWECQITLKNTPEIALWLSYFLTTKAVFWPHFCRLSYI